MDIESLREPSPAPDRSTQELEAPKVEPTEGEHVVKTDRSSIEEKEVSPPNEEHDDQFKRFGAEAPNPNAEVSKHLQGQEKKIRCLRRGLFWLVLGLAFVVLLVAAVGGSVGGSLAVLKSSKSSSSHPSTSPTTPSTSSTPPSPAPSSMGLPIGYTGCNASNGTTHISSGKAFTRICQLDWSLNTDDIVSGGIKALTLDACIDQCASWTGASCLGATYHSEVAIDGSGSSCWLKSSLPSSATKLGPRPDAAGGYLVQA